MQSIENDRPAQRTIEIKSSQQAVYSVLFTNDGKQVLSAGDEGVIRRWRVDDGHEVGEPIRVEGAQVLAVAVSPDGKWLACGLRSRGDGADVRVWNTRTHAKVLEIKDHTNTVFGVDVSPDSTKLATCSCDKTARIWNITTGERLVGPLQHEDRVVAVRFSPNGDRIATATAAENEKDEETARSIRIYDSENGQQLVLFDMPFMNNRTVTSLAWTSDGRQLFAASYGRVKHFDTSSGSLLREWSVPDGRYVGSVVLSRNQKFAVVAASESLSFWDISTYQQIGTVIEYTSTVWWIALSPNDDQVATGEENGKVTLRNLRDILPVSYLTVNLPLMCISETIFKPWTQGDLTRTEELLTRAAIAPSNTLYRAHTLAHRAVVRARSKRWEMAIGDAKESIKVQRSIIGYIAHAIALVGNGEHESALRAFDLVFTEGLPNDNKFLLLIRAVILFECGKYDDAILRVCDLIDISDDPSLYVTVRAQLYLLLGRVLMKGGDNKRAIELFKRAEEAVPFQQGPHLIVISLIFGWDFDRLGPAIQLQLYKATYTMGHSEVVESLSTMAETLGKEMLTSEDTNNWNPGLIQKCLATFESNGDVAAISKDFPRAVLQYSTALSLNPSDPVGLLVKRSNARVMLGFWEDALKDADSAIKADPLHPKGYEQRHAALHGLRRYDEAITAFSRMLSIIEESPNQETRQLGKKYLSPSRSGSAIDDIVLGALKVSPLVLIDVKNGRLCDGPERMRTFRLELQFKELVSSMTHELDNGRIQQVVEEYFLYVTLSHVWQGKEPSFQDVNLAGSVWKLESSSPLNKKLQNFCEVVRDNGYRWAWSDTACIDKTISTILNQSLTMMYKWYAASATTFVLLVDVDSPSALGNLLKSIWMMRAWTAQELLAAKAVRFYDRNWNPYLNDTRSNHKESPEIMQELADAIGMTRETITAFNPDHLSVRQKLRLAAPRIATVEEDVAYSLIGIFKSDIVPRYGEGDDALGHLLEEIVTRLGEVTVFAWAGKSSSYNSCLPASLAVYNQQPTASSPLEGAGMEMRAAEMQHSLRRPDSDVISFRERVIQLPPARFANRRLYLPCIVFAVERLVMRDPAGPDNHYYRARVSGIGDLDFRASETLSLAEPRRLIFVHPWIRDLQDPLDRFAWGSIEDADGYKSDSKMDSDSETEFESAPSSPVDAPSIDTSVDYTRALRLVVRLQQPFYALLLQQQPNGDFRRIAADHHIIIPGIDRQINFASDVRTEVVEVL